MFQEFYKDTLMSRFIKRLLRATKLPLYPLLDDGDRMVNGVIYIHKDITLRAKRSCIFNFNNTADYDILDKHLAFNSENTYNYHSKVMYHDSKTHEQLGDYLRYLKHQTGLNLFPFYNCYSNKSVAGIEILSAPNEANRYFREGQSGKYKLFIVPVKFGKTYTIALDSTNPVKILPIIYNDDSGMITYNRGATTSGDIYYTDLMGTACQVYPNTSFLKPFCYTVPFPEISRSLPIPNLGRTMSDTDIASLIHQERNLYLAIQVPATNTSSLTVLEGDYVLSNKPVQSNIGDAEILDKLSYRNLALLLLNTHTSYAFTDRLIEHLLHNPISNLTTIDNNILYCQQLLKDAQFVDAATYIDQFTWTDELRKLFINVGNQALGNTFIYDIDGYVNVDIEKYLYQLRKE